MTIKSAVARLTDACHGLYPQNYAAGDPNLLASITVSHWCEGLRTDVSRSEELLDNLDLGKVETAASMLEEVARRVHAAREKTTTIVALALGVPTLELSKDQRTIVLGRRIQWRSRLQTLADGGDAAAEAIIASIDKLNGLEFMRLRHQLMLALSYLSWRPTGGTPFIGSYVLAEVDSSGRQTDWRSQAVMPLDLDAVSNLLPETLLNKAYSDAREALVALESVVSAVMTLVRAVNRPTPQVFYRTQPDDGRLYKEPPDTGQS
jgi:hypothetical protein